MTRYRVTTNGGIRLADGSMSSCVIATIPTLRKGYAVYVRDKSNPEIVATYHWWHGEVQMDITHHGVTTPNVPDWALQFKNLLLA